MSKSSKKRSLVLYFLFIFISLASIFIFNPFNSVALSSTDDKSPPSTILKQKNPEPKLTCITASRGILENSNFPDAASKLVVAGLLEDIKNKDSQKIKKFFHSKLLEKADAIERSLQLLGPILGNPYTINLYRAWKLNVPEHNSESIDCPDEKISLIPHYGYKEQLYLIFQAQGSKELARIYVTMVKIENEWKVGSWHMQAWTHLGCDAQCLLDKVLVDGKDEASWQNILQLDLAQKLLTSSGYFVYEIGQEIRKTLETSSFKKSLLEAVTDQLGPTFKVKYVSSAFASDGPGLLIRFEVDPSLPLNALKIQCFKLAHKLSEKDSLKNIGGIFCAYLKPNESADRNGVLGSRFISRAEIIKDMK